MEYTARSKRKRIVYLIYIGMEWSNRPILMNGSIINNVDEWLSERIDVLINEKNINIFDTEPILTEMEEFFLKVKLSLIS